MQQAKTREIHYSIQSVRRAAAILRAFDKGSPELGVSEVGRKLNLHKSTVSRLLATLESEGLVERAPRGDKYRLGYEFVRLAAQVTHFSDVRAVARPWLAELAEATGETINLAVLDGREVVNVEQVSGPYLVGATSWVGRRTPLHCVANGKALIMHQTRAQLTPLLERSLPRFTRRTLTNKAALYTDLSRARKRGYATALGELEDGLNAVAAPIWDASGAVVAAVSVSGPSYRVMPEHIAQLGQQTIRIAAEISARLGASSSVKGGRMALDA